MRRKGTLLLQEAEGIGFWSLMLRRRMCLLPEVKENWENEGGRIMNFYDRALGLREETVTHRRWLQSNAEVGLQMPKAQAYVMEQLRESGL